MLRHLSHIAALVIAGAAASAAMAQATHPEVGSGSYLAPLDMAPFQDDTWRGYEQEGWYVLQNASDDGAIRYYQGRFLPEDGVATLRAHVYVRDDDAQGLTAAGLIFNIDLEAGSYTAFLMDSENNPMLLIREPDDMVPIFADEDDPVGRGDGSDVLEVRFQGNEAGLYLNDALFLNMDTQTAFHPRMGVVALGTGRFGYWGFGVD